MEAREVALLRLAAQRLIGPRCTSPLEVVRWMTALQAQDLPGAALSVALRCGARGCEAVHQALDAGLVVRSWPMRGTLHLVAAEDLPWMLVLLAPRADVAARRRRDRLGLDDAALARGAELVVAALEAAPAGSPGLRRRDLLDVLAAGCSVQGQAGAHLLTHLATSGLVVLVRPEGLHRGQHRLPGGHVSPGPSRSSPPRAPVRGSADGPGRRPRRAAVLVPPLRARQPPGSLRGGE